MAGEAAEDVKVEGEEDLEADIKEEDEAEEEVPLRPSAKKSNADFARERLALKEKKEVKEEDEELTPKARKLIEDAVGKAVAPLQDELAVRDYFAGHPDDRKFEKKARARFEAWGTVPIEEVLKTLRPSEDVEEKEKAEDKAKRGSIKGSTQRPKEETVATTQAELKKVYEGIKRGGAERAAAVRSLGIKTE